MSDEAKKFRAGANTHWKLRNGEGVVVDFETGNYFVLDDVCSFFWHRLMEKPHSVSELVTATLEEYDVDPGEAAESVRRFCEYMTAEKLAETL